MSLDTKELLKQSIVTIRELRAELDAARDVHQAKPIAIVGMGCRFPGGAESPQRYWDLLRSGRTTVTSVPRERWDADAFYAPPPGKPGRSYIREAHFLAQDVAEFDARFFKMPPVECRSTDPQHRLLLETSWHALEDAGIDPTSLLGSRTGVYLGISSNAEYGSLIDSVSEVNQYVSTGVISSVAAGRLSYFYGFNGPAVAIDTACSSSLVAVKLAMDALRQSECEVALAAGSSLMLAPAVMSSLCAMNALAPDGLSKPFSADADGYGRGEGCGVLVLKRLSSALEDNDRIWAVLRGAAVNNDGESSGLTVPNAHAQRDVLQRALECAQVAATEVDLIETHGTGTPLGDPIEVDAIRAVYGDRSTPLYLGAAKGNVGHLECASGMAGLVKAVLQLQHAQMVPVAGLAEVNPRIRLGDHIRFPQETEPWRQLQQGTRIAGVSSFGFSGTNAHVLVEQAPEQGEREKDRGSSPVLTLSAKTETALLVLARTYRDFLSAHPDVDLQAVCDQTSRGRAHFEHRLVLLPCDVADAVEALDEVLAWADGQEDLYAAGVEILGTSHGRDRYAAKRHLYQTLAHGRAFLAHTDHQIPPRFFLALGRDTTVAKEQRDDWLRWQGYRSGWAAAEAELTSHGTFATEFCHHYAVGMLLREVSIRPDLVSGSGAGALAAAVLCGVASLADVAAVVSALDVGTEPAPVIAHDPRVGYLAWSDATAVHGAEQTWAAMLADVQACEAQPPLDAAYESGYRFMVLNGTRPSGEQRDDMVLLPTADLDGQITMSRLMAQAEALGAFLAWPQMTVPLDRGLELPLYPFERSHYWFAGSTSHQQTLLAPRDFGLDGARLDFPGQDLKILHTLSAENFAEAADNSGAVHLGYFVEMLARAVAPVLPVETAFSIRWMDLLKAIIVPPDTPIEVLISLPAAVTEGAFAIHARLASETDWSLVARGELGAVHGDAPQEPLGAYRERMAAMTQEQFYSALELERGFYFGPAVRAVEQAWSGESAGVLRLEVAAGTPRRPFYTMGFHPGFVDACAQACNRFSMDSTPREQKYMVQRLEEVTLWSGPSTADVNSPRMGVVDVTGVSDDLQSISATFSITDQVGSVQLRVGLVRLKAFDEEKLAMLAGARRETSLGPDQLLLARFQRASQTGKVDLILNLLIELLTDILSLGPEEVLASTPMRDFGLDSMTGMDLYTQVADRTGSPLTFTDLLEAENLAALAHDVAQAMQRNPQETRGEESTDLSTGTWLRGFEPAPTEARVRLLCFPNGYRSADMFDEWQDILGPEIQVVGVMLPGIDGTRLRERPPVLIDEISKTIETVIAEPLADLPVATYGHSWGSLYSYRLAVRLKQTGSLDVIRTFVSGFTAPSRPNTATTKVRNELLKEGFDRIPTFEEIAAAPQRVASVVAAYVKTWNYTEAETKATLPQLLAACCLIDRYQPMPGESLDVPMSIFHGVDDYGVSLDDSRAWTQLGSAGTEFHVVAGDHQFVNREQSGDQVLQQIRATLLADLSRVSAQDLI